MENPIADLSPQAQQAAPSARTGRLATLDADVEEARALYRQAATATRVLLAGFAAGAPVVFRVSASKNKTTSEPTASVSPWERPVPSELRVA